MKSATWALSAWLLVFFTGCAPERISEVPKPVSVASSKVTEGADPVKNPKSRGNPYRAQLLLKAMQGVTYTTGRVTIDPNTAGLVVQGMTSAQATGEFEKGNELLQKGKTLEAIASFTRAVILDSTRAECYDGLGRAMLAERKLTEAEAAFRTALDRDPTHINARFKLAFSLNGQGRLDEAITELSEVVRRQPDHARAHSRLAISLYYADRWDEAKTHIAKAAALGFKVPPQLITLINGGYPPRPGGVGGMPQIGQQMRVDLGNSSAGNETSAASSALDPNHVIATWNDYRSNIRCGVSLSTDGGASWNDFLLRPPGAFQSSVEGDPMTAYDPDTGDLWAGAISFGGNGGVFVARKNAGDANFQPAVMAKVSGGADKGWMAYGVDPFDSNASRMYIGYNEGLLVSTNRGDSWTGPVFLPEFGLGWCPRVGPDGQLYMCYWDTDDGVKLVRSLDGGATIQGPINVATRLDVWGIDGTRFPGNFRVAPLNTMAVDPNNGNLYVTYFDTTNIVGGNRNVDIYFCKSTDQGLTWTDPVVINGDASPPGDQFFPWLEVDETGRINMLFYDTRSVVQNDNQFGALIEAYYSYSDDGGNSWNEIVLTDQPFNSANDGFGDGFIGDYLGMGVAGRYVYPCYMSTHEGIANVYVHSVYNTPTSFGPSNFNIIRGLLQSGGLLEVTDSDDQRMFVNPGLVLNSFKAPIRIEFAGTAFSGSSNQFVFRMESMASTPGLQQRIELFNYNSGIFELFDTRDSTTNDTIAEVVIAVNPEHYVDQENLEVKAQVSWMVTGPILQYPWTIGIDQIVWSQ